jgi:hypothetical protein
MLSRPKSVEAEFFQNPEEVTLIAHYAQRDVALHLWILLPNVAEPRFYSLPWNEGGKERSREIQQARKAHKGKPLIIKSPFKKAPGAWDVFPPPQKPYPEKAPPPEMRKFTP